MNEINLSEKILTNELNPGTLNIDLIRHFLDLDRDLKNQMNNQKLSNLINTCRIPEFVESINNSVSLIPSYMRYLSLVYSKKISKEGYSKFTFNLDIIEDITKGPLKNGGNFHLHVFPRLTDEKLFFQEIIHNRLCDKVSSFEYHNISPVIRQSDSISDKRSYLNYSPRIGIGKGVIFEARGLKQIISLLNKSKEKSLLINLVNYLILAKNITLSVLYGEYDLFYKNELEFSLNSSGILNFTSKENQNYKYPWDEK